MTIQIPNLSLVVLVGPSGSGKSTFARKHFSPTEILSSDFCRGLVSDDQNNQAATNDAFDVLNYIASKRLAAGRLTVIDATNVQPEARRGLVQLAKQYHVLPVAIVLNLSEQVCVARNQNRADRQFGPYVVRNQRSQLRRSLRGLKREGFRHVKIFESVEAVDAIAIERVPLWNDRREMSGPFDIIGDVHGCADELELLLQQLGYQITMPEGGSEAGWRPICYRHPEGRKAFFVGDLVDRGPRAVDVLSIVRNMVFSGDAMCVPGNHDIKLLRKLRGKNVQVKHGLAETLADLETIDPEVKPTFERELADFLDALVSHYVLDQGKLVVAHAGMKAEYQGRGSGRVREFALYGETTAESDAFGLPVRHDWAAEYHGDALVVYGHTPVAEPRWLNNTVNVDTGCVFGGKLTALRYPEMELVSIPAASVYCEPAKPFLESSESELSGQQQIDDVLDADDVIGKRIISTRLRPNMTIREENATAALEMISRFGVNPKWLIYLPPTMSPCESAVEDPFLEHPKEALDYYHREGVAEAICQEKHMGSRAVVVLARDDQTARQRFGIEESERGVIMTRTGRRFFNDSELESAMLDRLGDAFTAADFWNRMGTSWVCLDCELMPWSAKASELLRTQYAAVAAAADGSLPAVVGTLEASCQRMTGENRAVAAKLLQRFTDTQNNVSKFATAYRQYCWSVVGIDDYRLAPFHILAAEEGVYTDKDHAWHMQQISKLCEAECASGKNLMYATKHLRVDLGNPQSRADATDWWLNLTGAGGEGMVVKPANFIARNKSGILQPAIKCRGAEYLRIIYGPDYDSPVNLKRLRKRHVGRKRSLALREFALGIEALERFVRREPLRLVHQCVFGVLALESEPVDPRL